MKKVFKSLALFILLMMVSTAASAEFLGIKRATEFISMPLNQALDSSGIPAAPDSIHVVTYWDNATAAAMTDRSTTTPFATLAGGTTIDTIKYGAPASSNFRFLLVDQIQDIDGAGGNGTLTIMVALWAKKLPTWTHATVQVISDSLNQVLFVVGPKAAADSVWGKAFTTSWTVGSMGDSINNLSYVGGLTAALQASIGKAAADSTWNKPFNTGFTAGTMGDSLTNMSYVGNLFSIGGAANTAAVTGIEAAFDGEGATDKGTLYLSKLSIVATTTNDTGMVVQGNAAGPGFAAVAGSSATYAFGATATAASAYGIMGSSSGASGAGFAGLGGTGASAAGFYAFSGGAGNAFRLSGGTTGRAMYLTGGSTSGDAIAITAQGGSYGVNIAAATPGAGVSIEGNPGLSIRGVDGSGANAVVFAGDGSGNAINLSSETGSALRASAAVTSGNGHAFHLVAAGTGHGIYAVGGASAGDGANLEKGTGGDDLEADQTGTITTVTGNVNGSVASVTGAVGSVTAAVTVGTINANVITASSLADDAGNEFANQVWSEAQSGYTTTGTFGDNLDAIVSGISGGGGSVTAANMQAIRDTILNTPWGYTVAAGSLWDSLNNFTPLRAVAKTFADSAASVSVMADTVWNKSFGASFAVGSMGDSLNNPSYVQKIPAGGIVAASFGAGAIDANAIAADAITSSEWAASAAAEDADAVWDEARSGHTTAGTFGFYLDAQISTISGGGGSVTTQNIRDIGTEVWSRKWDSTYPAGSIGDSINNYTPARAAAKAIFDSAATLPVLGRTAADSTWGKLFTTTWGTGSMGDSLNNPSYVQMIPDVGITSSKFAADALTASALAASFGDEIADEVWNEDTASHLDVLTYGHINSGRSWSTPAMISDSVWRKTQAAYTTAGQFGNLLDLKVSLAGGGGALDSATTVRLIKRAVWGVELGGVGSIDSTPYTMRKIGNLTGNVTGSVASVTGAVGSVTGNVGGLVVGSVGSVAGNIGGNVVGSVASVTGSVGSVTGAVGSVTGNVGGNVVGSVGSVSAAVTVGGFNANTITAAAFANDAGDELADQIWDEDQATHVTDGTFGYNLNIPISTRSTYSGFTASDSGIISRVVGRKGWGIPQGNGADSLTAAQRVISSTGSVTITGGDILAIARAAADSVWNKNFLAAFPNGSMGDSLNNLSYMGGGGGSCAGSGQYAVSIYVWDTSAAPDALIPNARVTVNNPAQNAVALVAYTDITGKATFLLDNGTYIRQTHPAGYQINVDTFTVSSAARPNDQLQQAQTTGNLRPIVFRLDVPNATPNKTWVGFIQLRSVNDSDLVVGDTTISSNGQWSIRFTSDMYGEAVLPLWQNTQFTNDSTFYTISVNSASGSQILRPTKFRVDAGTTPIEWADVKKWRY